jgi:hypothetical protein
VPGLTRKRERFVMRKGNVTEAKALGAEVAAEELLEDASFHR